MTRVLLAFGEAVATPEVAWSLRDAGLRPTLLCRRGSRTAARRLRCCEIIDVTAPEDDAARCRGEIASAVERTGAAGVMPLDDAGLLLAAFDPAACAAWPVRREPMLVEPRVELRTRVAAGGDDDLSLHLVPEFAADLALDRTPLAAASAAAGHGPDRPFAVLGATGARARLALDKRRQFEMAERAGFAVPPTAYDAAAALRLPAGASIVKPLLAGRIASKRLVRDGAERVADPVAAAAALEDRLARGIPAAAQPVLRGTGEGIFGLAVDGDARLITAHRRIRMMHPAGSGSSACRSIEVDPALAAATRRFCRRAGWHGLFMIELLRDDAGRAWFMELNGRPWGSTALARRCGVEYPALHARAFLDDLDPSRLPPIADTPAVTCRHLGRELVHLAIVLRGTRASIPGWPGRLRTLRDLLAPARGTRWYHADAREPGYLLRDAWATLRSRLGGRGGGG